VSATSPGTRNSSIPTAGDEELPAEVTLVDPITQEVVMADSGIASVPTDMHIGDDDSDAEIAEKLIRQGVRLGRAKVAPRVFWPALIVVLAVAVVAVVLPRQTAEVFGGIQSWIVTNLGWYYVLLIAGFVGFVLFIGLSRLGTIRLGKDDEEPEFGLMSWFSMLFAAGMGIGMVFYGVGEPLIYATVSPKPGWEGSETELAGLAMAQAFIHWGLHPWAIYAVIGLGLAYAIHRRGRPVSIRWALEPILGSRVKGWIGDLIDILAIFGTLFGIATSLGLGVQQIAAGMKAIGIVEQSDITLLVILIVVITFAATLSVVSGIGAGIKWLSNINLSMAGVLMVTMLVLGPTLFLLENFVEALGVYLGNALQMTFDIGAFQGDGHAWYADWTIFYWGWWIAWAPFVGVFIARISRGRTVREFIAGVLVVPSIVGFVWFSVMGGSGLHRQLFGAGDLVEDGQIFLEGVLFKILADLPLGEILSVMAIVLVAIFFITSSDSGSLVVDMLASGGHPNPPTWSRVLWSALEGGVAIALLIAGGLGSLQAASLATALPFSVILLLMCVATLRGLRYEIRRSDHMARMKGLNWATEHITDEVLDSMPDNPKLRTYLDDRIDYRLGRSRTKNRSRDFLIRGRGRRRAHDGDRDRSDPGR
jgi:choline/glycine/proline betaine transport protein